MDAVDAVGAVDRHRQRLAGDAVCLPLVVARVGTARTPDTKPATTSERLIESFAALERTSTSLEARARYFGLLQNCRDAGEAVEITARTIAPLICRAAGAVCLLCASRDRAEQVVAWSAMADAADSASIATDTCWALRVVIARMW